MVVFPLVFVWIFACQIASRRWRGEKDENLKKEKIPPAIRWLMHTSLALVVLGPVGKSCLWYKQGAETIHHRRGFPDA